MLPRYQQTPSISRGKEVKGYHCTHTDCKLPSAEDGILAKEVSRAQPISSPVPEHVVLLPYSIPLLCREALGRSLTSCYMSV